MVDQKESYTKYVNVSGIKGTRLRRLIENEHFVSFIFQFIFHF